MLEGTNRCSAVTMACRAWQTDIAEVAVCWANAAGADTAKMITMIRPANPPGRATRFFRRAGKGS